MSEDFRRAIVAEADRLAALEDARGPVAAVNAVAQLRREGWSYDRIAAATNLSKGRVAQLAREARVRRL